MNKNKVMALRAIGVVGALTCLILFINQPSFPTPDKLIVFMTFIFMMFSQAIQMLKKLLPFVAVILTYESFRSVADKLNTHVDYSFAPHMDKLLFGGLPTVYLQELLWHGNVSWYDFVFYFAYLLHFVIPIGLAVVVWKTREKQYWRVVNTYLVTAFLAFLTFLMFPAAPPWLASENHYIEPIVRVSSDVWQAFGLGDFPSFYSRISPNPVAAVPSLHAAWATLLVIFVYKLYGRRWAVLAAVYPLLIYVGTVYQGEHYAFDEILGVVYAIAGYKVTPYIMRWASSRAIQIRTKYSSNTKTVSKSAK
jgi:hypothetical protein